MQIVIENEMDPWIKPLMEPQNLKKAKSTFQSFRVLLLKLK